MTATSSILLASGDEPQPYSLDATVWRENLAALQRVDAPLADRLAAAAVPPHWRAVHALDGFPTWRTETPGAPAAWLGGTALPRRRAAALLAGYQSADRNPALPTLGTGAEPLDLLERLPPHVAVYVFLDDPTAAVAVLRTTPLAAALAAGRLILIAHDEPRAHLAALLAERPGLLPPATLLLADRVPAERVTELKALCQAVAVETNERRAAELAALQIDATPRDQPPPRLAVLALQPAGPTHALAEELARAAGTLGWPTHVARVDGPGRVDGLCHSRDLATLRPSLTVCVNHLPAVLPVVLPEPVCVWVLSAAQAAALPTTDAALALAASPTIAEALRSAGVPDERVLSWYWACGDTAPAPAPTAPPSGVLLIGDRPADRPEFFGITQDTHRQLWEAVRNLAAQAWGTPLGGNAEQLLIRAEQQTGIRLRDAALREHLLRAVADALVPAVSLTAIAEELAREHTVHTVGAGWEAWSHPRHTRRATGTMLPPPAEPEPLLCVAAGGRDPLSGALVAAAAAGWPVLVHRPAGGPPPALGEVLRPGAHCETFVDTRDLRRHIQLTRERSPAVRQRAARAAEHVRAFHSYRQRWQDLVRRLGIAWA